MVNRHFKTGAAVVLAGALFAAGGMGTATAAKLITGDDIDRRVHHLCGPGLQQRRPVRAEGQRPRRRQGRDSGEKGAKGAKGDTGPAGESGTAGAEGVRGAQGAQGAQGIQGPQGPAGPSGYEGAFYAVANYDVGDTNAGAIATVACDSSSQAFTAVAGGVQSLGLGGHPAAVASSFPGRMDWTTNTPKANRLDGWVIQFDADQAPTKVKIWALCVPRTDIPVVQTFLQSAG